MEVITLKILKPFYKNFKNFKNFNVISILIIKVFFYTLELRILNITL